MCLISIYTNITHVICIRELFIPMHCCCYCCCFISVFIYVLFDMSIYALVLSPPPPFSDSLFCNASTLSFVVWCRCETGTKCIYLCMLFVCSNCLSIAFHNFIFKLLVFVVSVIFLRFFCVLRRVFVSTKQWKFMTNVAYCFIWT